MGVLNPLLTAMYCTPPQRPLECLSHQHIIQLSHKVYFCSLQKRRYKPSCTTRDQYRQYSAQQESGAHQCQTLKRHWGVCLLQTRGPPEIAPAGICPDPASVLRRCAPPRYLCALSSQPSGPYRLPAVDVYYTFGVKGSKCKTYGVVQEGGLMGGTGIAATIATVLH